MEFGHAVFERVLLQGPRKAIETISDQNPPRKSKKNVVENGHDCCGIYSTPCFAVVLVFGRGGTRYRGGWIPEHLETYEFMYDIFSYIVVNKGIF